METIYRKPFQDYTMVVHKHAENSYQVLLLLASNVGMEIETVETRHHALKGADKFPVFYEIAKSNGYHLTDHYFRHKDGSKELHASYAMDLDCTLERFLGLLQQ